MKSESPTDVESLDMPAHPFSVCSERISHSGDCWLDWKSVDASGVHEIFANPESFLSSLLMMTRPHLVGGCWSLMLVALRSSMVHPEASLCQGKDQIAHIMSSCCAQSISSPVHNRCSFVFYCKMSWSVQLERNQALPGRCPTQNATCRVYMCSCLWVFFSAERAPRMLDLFLHCANLACQRVPVRVREIAHHSSRRAPRLATTPPDIPQLSHFPKNCSRFCGQV